MSYDYIFEGIFNSSFKIHKQDRLIDLKNNYFITSFSDWNHNIIHLKLFRYVQGNINIIHEIEEVGYDMEIIIPMLNNNFLIIYDTGGIVSEIKIYNVFNGKIFSFISDKLIKSSHMDIFETETEWQLVSYTLNDIYIYTYSNDKINRRYFEIPELIKCKKIFIVSMNKYIILDKHSNIFVVIFDKCYIFKNEGNRMFKTSVLNRDLNQIIISGYRTETDEPYIILFDYERMVLIKETIFENIIMKIIYINNKIVLISDVIEIWNKNMSEKEWEIDDDVNSSIILLNNSIAYIISPQACSLNIINILSKEKLNIFSRY